MTASDILTLVLSGLAFLFSVGTFIYTTLRAAKLIFTIEDTARFSYTVSGELAFSTHISIFNVGARLGVVSKVFGTISTLSEDRKADFSWAAFQESKNVSSPGEGLRIVTGYAGEPEPLIIPGSGAVVKLVRFATFNEFPVIAGEYILEFLLIEGTKLRGRSKGKYRLIISAEEEQYLQVQCKQDPQTMLSATLPKRLKKNA